MELIYKKIASVEFWFDYLLPSSIERHDQIPEDYNIYEYFDLKPNQQTSATLQEARIKIHKTKKGLDLYVESIWNGAKYIAKNPIKKNHLLAFQLIVKRPEILLTGVFTNSGNECFSISNLNTDTVEANDGSGGFIDVHYLSGGIETYVGANTYALDAIVKNGKDKFLSLQNNNDKATSNTAFWRNLGRISLLGNVHALPKFKGGFVTPAGVDVKGKATMLKNTLNQEIASQQIAENLNEKGVLQIPQEFDGRVDFYVNGTLDSSHVKITGDDHVLGIIELAIQGDPSNLEPGTPSLSKEYMLMGNGEDGTTMGDILENKWVVRVVNRSTTWNYHFNKTQTFNNTDLAAAGFQKISDKEIESIELKPLSSQAEIVDAGLGILLPNPKMDSLKIRFNLNNEVEEYVSELYVNN